MLTWAQQSGRPEVVAFLPDDGPVAFSSDGKSLVSLFPYNDDGRQTVQLSRIQAGGLVPQTGFVLPRGKYLLGVSPDARLLAVSGISKCGRRGSGYAAGSVGRLELIEFPSGRVARRLEGPSLCGLTYPVFAPDASALAVPNRQGYVELWSPRGRRLRTLSTPGEVDAVAFSRDSSLLAVCGERLEVFRVADGRRVLRLPDTAAAASSCRDAPPVFTPDGSGLLLADGQKPVGWWSLTGRLSRSFALRAGQPAQRVAISGNGRFVLTVDQGQGLAVYAATTGQMLYQTARGGYGLVVSPGLEYFATNNPPKLWRLR